MVTSNKTSQWNGSWNDDDCIVSSLRNSKRGYTSISKKYFIYIYSRVVLKYLMKKKTKSFKNFTVFLLLTI